MCEIKFPGGKVKSSNSEIQCCRRKKKNTVCQSKWKSYVHCSTVWNCPWGSRGNYKAAKGGDKEEVVFFYHPSAGDRSTLASGSFSPLSEPVLQSIRWTGRCAKYISVSSLCGLHTDGTIAESGQQLLELKHKRADDRWSENISLQRGHTQWGNREYTYYFYWRYLIWYSSYILCCLIIILLQKCAEENIVYLFHCNEFNTFIY